MTPRTISLPPPISPIRLHGGRPVLEPDPRHAWESRVVLNPAAVLVDPTIIPIGGIPHDGRQVCAMLYRAQGERRLIGNGRGGAAPPPENAKAPDDARASNDARASSDDRPTSTSLASRGSSSPSDDRATSSPDQRHPLDPAPSFLGLALFTPTLDLVYRHPDPVLAPQAQYDRLGVEDPRCTRVDDTFFLYYTGYAGGEDVAICLATTQDFLTWQRHGPATGINDWPNKNAALLPEPVDDRWILLHRPMQGPDAMTIHWAESDRPEGPWRTRGKLMPSYGFAEFARSWIGAGGPPVSLGGGRFLMIYHQGHFTPEGTREYDLAAALLDFTRPSDPVVGRIEPLMRPTGASERQGDPDLGVDNVLFTCANYVLGDDLIIPYAGADSRIFGASIPLAGLAGALETAR